MVDWVRSWLGGAAVGAGVMYMLDPDRGRRRRARVRDKAVHLRHQLDDAAGVTSRDLQHRAKGVVAQTKSRFSRDQADDSVLEARVRSELGRLVTHPGAIQVMADNGRVTLAGPVLEDEVTRLIAGVRLVRGVKTVKNRLEAHREGAHIPSLQGGRDRPLRPQLLQEHWAPAHRLLVGTAGALLIGRGLLGDQRLRGLALYAAGSAMLLRSITNLPLRRVTGFGAGRRAVELRKDINVNAPVEEVFAFWENFENFPRFMTHIKEVHRLGERRSHWVAEGRGGVHVEWDAETTVHVPNEVIGWRSVNGSAVDNAGLVRFQPNEHGGTRVTIQLSYNPPLGALGHAVASLLGTDPRHLMHDDMVRFKSLVEEGKTTADQGQVGREELRGPPHNGFRAQA